MQIPNVLDSEAITYSLEIPQMLRVLLESEMLPEQLLELLLGHPSYFELDQKYKNRLFLFYMNCTIKQLTPNSSSRKAYEVM